MSVRVKLGPSCRTRSPIPEVAPRVQRRRVIVHAGSLPHAEGPVEDAERADLYVRLEMSPPMLDGLAVDNAQGFDRFTA